MRFLDWRSFLAEKLTADIEKTFVDGWYENRGHPSLVAVGLVKHPILTRPASLHRSEY